MGEPSFTQRAAKSRWLRWFPWWEKVDAVASLLGHVLPWGTAIAAFFGMAVTGVLQLIGVGLSYAGAFLSIVLFGVLGVVALIAGAVVVGWKVSPIIAELAGHTVPDGAPVSVVGEDGYGHSVPIRGVVDAHTSAEVDKDQEHRQVLWKHNEITRKAEGERDREIQKRIDAERRVAVLEDQNTKLTNKAKNFEEERPALKQRIVDLIQELEWEQQEKNFIETQLRESEARVTFLVQQERYGINEMLTVDEELSEVALEVAHIQLKNCRETMDGAANLGLGIARSLGQQLERDDNPNKRLLAQYLWGNWFLPADRLYSRLTEELVDLATASTRRIDYRVWLLHYYRAYNRLRWFMWKTAELLDFSLVERKGYREWWAYDKAFLSEIGKIGVMQDLINDINQRCDFPFDLPEPSEED